MLLLMILYACRSIIHLDGDVNVTLLTSTFLSFS
jgi:hypothetical protein